MIELFKHPELFEGLAFMTLVAFVCAVYTGIEEYIARQRAKLEDMRKITKSFCIGDKSASLTFKIK